MGKNLSSFVIQFMEVHHKVDINCLGKIYHLTARIKKCKILLLDRFLIHGAHKLHKGSNLVRLDHYVGILLETKIAMKFGDDAVIY